MLEEKAVRSTRHEKSDESSDARILFLSNLRREKKNVAAVIWKSWDLSQGMYEAEGEWQGCLRSFGK